MNNITQDDIKALFKYDRETGVFIWRERTLRNGEPFALAGENAGTVTTKGYRHLQFSKNGKTIAIKAHRAAWLYETGEWPVGQIDHINGLRDDNRFANLRDVSNDDNCLNRVQRVRDGWRLTMKMDGLTTSLTFPSRDEAVQTRLKIAQKRTKIL